ncbi:MAG: hypothetical protein IBV53_09390 [Candidatus Atribacteria bacterium]
MIKSVFFIYSGSYANDVEELKSGDAKKIARREKNKNIGRKLIKKIW